MVWCALWLLASLGLRWLGLLPAFAALRRGPRAGAVLAAMALSAWPLGLAFRIAVTDALPGQKVVNDAAYIVEQGGAPAVALHRGRPRRPGHSPRTRSPPWPSWPWPCPRPSSSSCARPKRPPIASPPRWCAPSRPCAPWRSRATSSCSDRVHATRPPPCSSPTSACPTSATRPSARSSPRRRPSSAATSRCFASSGPRTRPRPARSPRDLGASYVALYGPDRVRFDPIGPARARSTQEGDARVYRIRA